MTKIEKALERFINWPGFEHKFNHCGAMNATQLSDRDWFLKLKREAFEALATLRAALEDYEKARPLLEAVSGALVYGADDPGPEPVFDHDCLTVILEKALAYKESSHD